MRTIWFTLVIALCFSGSFAAWGDAAPVAQEPGPAAEPGSGLAQAADTWTYLPLVVNRGGQGGAAVSAVRRVNAPYFSQEINLAETAIFWFGRVSLYENYADVRVGYTDQYLYLRLTAFDRHLWYDPQPEAGDLTDWDGFTVYLDLDGAQGAAVDDSAYRFAGQLHWWEQDRSGFQTAYRGAAGGWQPSQIAFTTRSSWRGNAPNNDVDGKDRGWNLIFEIPFASLGLSGPPSAGTVWGLGVEMHDRDGQDRQPEPVQRWPSGLDASRPGTWGQLAFGLPTYTPPSAAAAGSVTIRDRLNGATVPDAAVGGTTGNLCPGSDSYIWNDWGNANFKGARDFNIQNQEDVADWPCFSKYYITFPLDQVPAGVQILSATLTLHQFGNSGGGEWGEPPDSLIQVFTVAEDWNEDTLTWNNAPLARENIARTRVIPMSGPIVWPGVPWTWDVSRAAAEAYAAGQPLRLVLYSADATRHTGKYFTASDADDWNAKGRPTLEVTWGD